MNQHLQNILNTINGDKNLSGEEKNAIIKSLKDADKEFEITNFKLDRTEKVKRTTAILLEETIEELEQKRKAVEAQNKELEIESSLERVRTVAMSMNKALELLEVCKAVFVELHSLGFADLRNALIHTYQDENNCFDDYDYSDFTKGHISKIPYSGNTIIEKFIRDIRKSGDAFAEAALTGDDLQTWKSFRDANNEAADERLAKAGVLYYYFYSIGNASIGISTFSPVSTAQREILKRFRNVFDLAYKRYVDISKAEAQAKEAQIEAALEKVRSRSLAMQKSDELKEVIQVVYEQFVHLKVNTEHTGFVIDYKQRDDRLIWVAGKRGLPSQLTIPSFDCEYYNRFNEAKQQGLDFFATNLNFEDKNSFYRELFKYIPGLPEEGKEFYFNCPGLAISTVLLENVALYIENFEGIPYSDEDNATLMRFGKVFQQTYTRFLDLQKAEAQAKESQIELGLERVRAKAMAMQNSDELKELISTVFIELTKLDLVLTRCVIMIYDAASNDSIWWMANSEAPANPLGLYVKNHQHPPYASYVKGWHERKNKFQYTLEGKDKDDWDDFLFSETGLSQLPDFVKAGMKAPAKVYLSASFNNFGCLNLATLEPLSEDHFDILLRFARVFDLTYTRFNDLQKAEAQAREATIETALEKVRSRSLAMHKSSEIGEVIWIIVDKMKELNIEAQGISVATFISGTSDLLHWHANAEIAGEASTMMMPYFDNLIFNDCIHARDTGMELLAKLYSKEEKDSYINAAIAHTDFKYFPETLKQWILEQPCLSFSFAIQKHSGIFLEDYTGKIFSKEDNDILIRFSRVFEQSYVRFLDLQKAEAQAREAEIELALERVRAKTMAMHESADLLGVINLLSEQFQLLGFKIHSANFNTSYREKIWNLWLYNPGVAMYPHQIQIPYFDHPFFNRTLESLANNADFSTLVFSKKEKDRFLDHIYANTLASHASEERKKYTYDAPGFAWSVVYLKNTSVTIANYDAEPYTEEQNIILRRFGNVFEQTYTRFLDLQKAEAQAREAQIEASLERVRSKAMSMQKSEDLANAVAIVFEEVDKLNLGILRCGIGILNKEKRCAQVWTTTKSDNNTVVQVSGDESMDVHPLLQGAFEAWVNHQVDQSYVLRGEDLHNYYKALIDEDFLLPDSQSLVGGTNEMVQYYYNAIWSSGGLFAFSESEFTAEAKTIMRRFADVFDFTYTRFNDLKQAEAQAKEAQIEVALERVRSRTLAMQKSDELAETAAVLFKQLILLGIEPNRLYINIIKNENGEAEFWITDEDGSKVSSAFETNLNDNLTFKKMFDGWKAEKKSLVISMEGEELQEYFKYLTGIGVPFKSGLTQKRRVQDISYFSQGFIGIASPEEQPEETSLLLERFAAVFNLTYTRFNDLKIAEAHALQAEEDLIKLQAEKKRAEDALTELRATQTQLIQSEKMASLGELTAGIAHEIQNPLNFVNNFSDVSTELVEEMNAEIDKGNLEDAKQIALDLKQNLEKINHHGKRAGDIVKGMLQHSRSSSGTKEPTNINALADEYLRLAYHGLRAKDKTFNAAMKTEYDESIGNINIIPQDMGRVILNLITNAFYAVNTSRPPKGGVAYAPAVSVTTKKSGDKVLISVSDNGSGIPKNIIDKIFQPFFTTKPTGQGTGLGLSLSYDIVKAHGGELKVQTEEGKGTTFIIQLPAN